MKRLIVDMDGVLADVYQQFLAWEERDTGTRPSLATAVGKSESTAFPRAPEYVRTPGFFRTLPVMPDSPEILAALNQRYELFIVSSATEYPQSLPEKQAWLGEHFPFISWQQMVFCGTKRVVAGDIMIDDHFKNLDAFPGATLLFTQPHNQLSPAGRHTRVHTWPDIARLLG